MQCFMMHVVFICPESMDSGLFYRTAAGMESVAKRPAAGGESCKAGFFLNLIGNTVLL